MTEHQTIFSIKELRNKAKSAFPDGIVDLEQKIKIIEEFQKSINSGKALTAKEEELKPQFLYSVFGKILGYEFENSETWNLQLENKTALDNTKSDAALGFFGIKNKQEITKDIRVVIEIKNARTILDKQQSDSRKSAVEQCFMYAAKSGEKCKWVIVSNFLEIRLYLANDMTKYESFDILSLTDRNEFYKFYYLLANGQLFLENTETNVDILLAQRHEQEKTITKEFYNKYKYLREIFVQHLKKHNPEYNTLDLLQYAQTIIDRILFVSVIKDYGLINYNALPEIESIASKSWADDNSELWRQLIQFFKALDKGLPPRIFKFNGGLFQFNEIINKLNIKDIFLKQLLELNNYDFESDLNVNILGHIFEQSITDIEDFKKDLIGNIQFEYSETDEEIIYKSFLNETNIRKKEGIYYTPENITQLIVNKTVGKWLHQKKEEIGIYKLSEFPQNNEEINEHLKLWEQYKIILRNIKILDPACGSGAFLAQTFDFLVKEWEIVFDIIKNLTNEKPVEKGIGLFTTLPRGYDKSISKIKKEIINNNLFGVDLNYESVEITKLSLWLKSASKNDALALLDKNIKCGNSLISDSSVSEKAFVWENEFADILKSGGFDIVVGNPPYVFTRELITDIEKRYFKETYENTQFKINTYILFIEKSYHLLNQTGYFGFIVPNTWLSVENASDFRKFLLTNTFDIQIINSQDKIFSDANVDNSILIFNKCGKDTIEISELIDSEVIAITKTNKNIYLKSVNYIINYNTDNSGQLILDKINEQSIKLIEITKISDGILPYEVGAGKPKQTKDIRDNKLFHSEIRHDKVWLKLIISIDVQRYFTGWSGQYIKYGENLSRPRNPDFFNCPRILVRHIPAQPPYSIYATFVDGLVINDNNSMIITNNSDNYYLEYILALVNSKLISFWFSKSFNKLHRKLFPQFIVKELSSFPIKPIEKPEQQIFANYAKKIIENNKILHDKINKFKSNLITNFDKIKVTQNLSEFYSLDFKEFIEELAKQRIRINLKKQDEWLDYFNLHKQSVNELIIENNELNNKIDYLVYKLYNLSSEEIEIIENQQIGN